MHEDIVLDISDIVAKQKESKAKRFKASVLAVGIIVLAALTLAAYWHLPLQWFFLGISFIVSVTSLTYSIPSLKERKFMIPYVTGLLNELNSRGYRFADGPTKNNLFPWFSSQSAYLYGDGLVLQKRFNKGLKMRQIRFAQDHHTTLLTVERIMSGKKTLIRVVSGDGSHLAARMTDGESQDVRLVIPPDVHQNAQNKNRYDFGLEGNSSFAWDPESLT